MLVTPSSTDISLSELHPVNAKSPIPENTTKGEPAHYHYDVRYLLQAPHEAFNISSESDDLHWWSKEDFTNRQAELDASVIRMAKRYFGT